MERERPEYLEAIPRTRWEFPWMTLWAVLLLTMVGAGIWQHLQTSDAWSRRFVTGEGASKSPEQVLSAPPVRKIKGQAGLAGHDRSDSGVERPKPVAPAEKMRCINGTALRRIEGGWENVPGYHCP
ncbi:hypothetical protein [uncultured Stenotrophomonas sp.]|uniref:hypothetical protein n=1 Tax=uncultured Stenotrophomonas sp. TaxID=165438 RepID=UPI0025F0F5A3|nr:hypothetical protein [uncultured Stenotrophomonas sp.]